MHPGVVRMKAIARSFVLWPGIDSDIGEMVRSCPECSRQRNAPTAAPLMPWPWATRPWQRVHVDFAEKNGNMFLVVAESHPKWLEVLLTKRTSAGSTITEITEITEMKKLFSAYELPESVVSENGPQFTAEEFETFLKLNGVKHVLCPPYHPASNGLVERNVQTFNNILAKADPRIPLQHRISDILFQYRNTPHCITGLIPPLSVTVSEESSPNKVNPAETEPANQGSRATAERKTTPCIIYQPVRMRNTREGEEKWRPGTVT